MRFGGVIAASLILAATGFSGAASAMPGQSASRATSVTLSEAGAAQRNAPTTQRRGLRLTESGRWGLDLNLNQPVGRETDWGDVEAGAYYRLNDRLRVGAAAGLATPETDPARAPESNSRAQPRVRLETIFKF